MAICGLCMSLSTPNIKKETGNGDAMVRNRYGFFLSAIHLFVDAAICDNYHKIGLSPSPDKGHILPNQKVALFNSERGSIKGMG